MLDETRVEFPVLEGRLPTYVNTALTNVFNNDVIIDFGFVDPLILASRQANDTNEEQGDKTLIQAHPVVRLAMSLPAAEQLRRQLEGALDKVRELQEQQHD